MGHVPRVQRSYRVSCYHPMLQGHGTCTASTEILPCQLLSPNATGIWERDTELELTPSRSSDARLWKQESAVVLLYHRCTILRSSSPCHAESRSKVEVLHKPTGLPHTSSNTWVCGCPYVIL